MEDTQLNLGGIAELVTPGRATAPPNAGSVTAPPVQAPPSSRSPSDEERGMFAPVANSHLAAVATIAGSVVAVVGGIAAIVGYVAAIHAKKQ